MVSRNQGLVLTDHLYDLSQQYSIGDIMLQVPHQALVTRPGEVVIGPICVDLPGNRTHKFSICPMITQLAESLHQKAEMF